MLGVNDAIYMLENKMKNWRGHFYKIVSQPQVGLKRSILAWVKREIR